MLAFVLRCLIALVPAAALRWLLTRCFIACTIRHGDAPYLTRWTLRSYANGGHLYLHFFHRGDGDQELHNHPWLAHGVILAYGYREERRTVRGIETHDYPAGAVTALLPNTFHRVDLLQPSKGCWTLLTVGDRVQSWGFWSRETDQFTPWREFVSRKP